MKKSELKFLFKLLDEIATALQVRCWPSRHESKLCLELKQITIFNP